MNCLSRLLAALVALSIAAVRACACPLCESDTGERVRSGIFDGDFTANVVLTALPFAILFGIVAAIHFGGPRPKSGPH